MTPMPTQTSRVALLGLALAGALGLAGCGGLGRGPSNADLAPVEGQIRPMPRPGAGVIPEAGAVTVEQFDTTSDAERAAAAAPASGGAPLGRTVATLGNPADPGFWLETPLVQSVRHGRVVAVATGKSVQVELRPIAGEAGAGSRISLPALRLLEVGLTGLHELDVFAG